MCCRWTGGQRSVLAASSAGDHVAPRLQHDRVWNGILTYYRYYYYCYRYIYIYICVCVCVHASKSPPFFNITKFKLIFMYYKKLFLNCIIVTQHYLKCTVYMKKKYILHNFIYIQYITFYCTMVKIWINRVQYQGKYEVVTFWINSILGKLNWKWILLFSQ